MAINYTKPKAWESYQRNPPAGYRPLTSKEALADQTILTRAREFINRKVGLNAPLGNSEQQTINGKDILFIVEPHFHEPNGPTKPWGWHKGASLFIRPATAAVASQGWGGMGLLRESESSVHGERFNLRG